MLQNDADLPYRFISLASIEQECGQMKP